MNKLSSAGPGLIEGLSCVEASMIGTYAYIFGTDKGTLLWAVIVPFLLWPLIEASASLLGEGTRMNFLEIIKKKYGDGLAALAALSLLASNLSAMVAELIAASLALSMLSGFPWPVFVPISLSVLFLAPSASGKHWKLIVLMGSLPMLAFPATALLAILRNPISLGLVGSGVFRVNGIFSGSDVIAIIGATVAPDAIFFAEESGYEEKTSFLGVGIGHVVALLVSLSVAITFALSFAGVPPSSLVGIAGALTPTLGNYAYLIFPVALFSSCVAAFAVALKPWLSSLSFLTGLPRSRREEFLPATVVLVMGTSLYLGLMESWRARAFEQAAYTSGVISSIGLIAPLILLSALVFNAKNKKNLPLSLKVFLPLYSLLLVGIVFSGLLSIII